MSVRTAATTVSLLVLLMLAVLIAPGSSGALADPTLTPTITLPPNGTPIPDWVRGWSFKNSPAHSADERWEVRADGGQPVTVQSLLDPSLTFTDTAPLGVYSFFQQWFPDNSGFIVYEADQGCERCPFDRLLLFHIGAGGLKRYEFEPLTEPNKAFWSLPSWSPDGTQFVIVVHQRQVYIVDRQGQVIEELTPPLHTESEMIDQVEWTPSGVVYAIRDASGFLRQMKTLVMEKMSEPDEVLFSSDGYPSIHAHDPGSPRLMIHLFTNPEKSPTTGEMAILNMETKTIERVLLQHGDEYPYLTSCAAADQPYVALTDADGHLLIYDWRTSELRDMQIQITRIVGWREDLQSFVVVQSDGHWDSSWLVAVKPE